MNTRTLSDSQEARELDGSGSGPALVEEGAQGQSTATTAETGETCNESDRTNVMTAIAIFLVR